MKKIAFIFISIFICSQALFAHHHCDNHHRCKDGTCTTQDDRCRPCDDQKEISVNPCDERCNNNCY